MSYKQATALAASLTDAYRYAEPTLIGRGVWAVVAIAEGFGEDGEVTQAVTFIAEH